MVLLAVDTSTQWTGLALYDGEQVLGEIVWRTRAHHTVELAPAIQELLKRSEASVQDLRALAVALGPGSFTSLRIGLAAVKGLALALQIPIVGIPSLDVVAAAQPESELPLLAVLQAGRGRLACARYQYAGRGWSVQSEPAAATAEQLLETLETRTLIAGELTAADRQVFNRKRKYAKLVSPARSLRRPSFLAELGWQRWQKGAVDEVIGLAPIYLHTAEAIPEP
ncbi:MAG TPA: tRNA (adenosine(37)-N6)-threonylcarbamoyltransferase complex dimerization subunit type 1 TsaB [Chloroflexi bacterium]|jgi:tRNA threonylcarbamoyladenosine biosynthesis protein TsaB|nr:tRNA (adenosine(37)-N6)-threonylcarbamoyltransferase complex dimerization subunit type 1 TsaB [Chloroflexota bacterium]